MSVLSLQQQRNEDATSRTALLERALLAQELPLTISASGAIAPGAEQVFITAGSAAALTLPNPVAGAPLPGGAGGQDGATLVITSTTAFAHTVTTGTNGVNGSKHVITFPATAYATVFLKAFNGTWVVQVLNGATLT